MNMFQPGMFQPGMFQVTRLQRFVRAMARVIGRKTTTIR